MYLNKAPGRCAGGDSARYNGYKFINSAVYVVRMGKYKHDHENIERKSQSGHEVKPVPTQKNPYTFFASFSLVTTGATVN